MPRAKPVATTPDAALRELEALSFAIAHDLRQPILGARVALDGLEASSTEARRELGISLIRSCLDEALERIQGLLRLAGLTRDAAPVTRLDLPRLLAASAARIEATHPASAVRFEVTGSGEVHTVRALLGIVVDNLLDNAIRHGTRPERVLAVSLTAEPIPGGARISITDDGPGIPAEQRDAIFLPFARGSRSGSTGIGLATARRAARAIGGDLCFEPVNPTGARFVFTLADVGEARGVAEPDR